MTQAKDVHSGRRYDRVADRQTRITGDRREATSRRDDGGQTTRRRQRDTDGGTRRRQQAYDDTAAGIRRSGADDGTAAGRQRTSHSCGHCSLFSLGENDKAEVGPRLGRANVDAMSHCGHSFYKINPYSTRIHIHTYTA